MATVLCPPLAAGHGLLPPVSSLPPERRGRLRNGARPGDFLAAPRCGARTRAGGCCRQPAMKNGRCRMHGGLSTGPRTPEGRARCAAARTIHGGYNAAARALQGEARAAICRLRALCRPLRAAAGHGVLRQDPVGAAPCGLAAAPGRGRPRAVAPTGHPARVHRRASAVESPSTAGHGVLSSRPSLRQRALLGTTALGISVRHPFTAGHGVLSFVSAGAAR
jgi:hypothetical protein